MTVLRRSRIFASSASVDDAVAVVGAEEARAPFYPYVFVENEGSVRELHRSEKQLLETPFSLRDSARPHIKKTYDQRDSRGNLGGYCPRSAISNNRKIGYPPVEFPVGSFGT